MYVRGEQPADYAAIDGIHRDAFGRPDEGRLVAVLRAAGATFISLVAEYEGKLAGHVLFSPVFVQVPERDLTWPAVALGPLGVCRRLQGRGIGSALVTVGLEACRQRDHKVVFVLGDPAFYTRFGFVTAARRGLHWEHPAPPENFMVWEDAAGGLRGRVGTVRYHPAFSGVDEPGSQQTL